MLEDFYDINQAITECYRVEDFQKVVELILDADLECHIKEILMGKTHYYFGSRIIGIYKQNYYAIHIPKNAKTCGETGLYHTCTENNRLQFASRLDCCDKHLTECIGISPNYCNEYFEQLKLKKNIPNTSCLEKL